MQSRVKHYVLIKRLMAMILTAKLLYAQTLCYVVIVKPYQPVTKKTLFLVLQLMC